MLTNAAVLEGTCRKEISIYNIKIDQYNIYILEIYKTLQNEIGSDIFYFVLNGNEIKNV